MSTTELTIKKVIVMAIACFAVVLIGIRAIPELDRMQLWLVTAPAHKFLTFWAPIEPAEVMLFAAPRALESRMPRTAIDIVLKGEDSRTNRILSFD